MVADAAGQGTVTASSANIRKEASTTSEAVGSVQSGNTVTINSEVQGSDGKTWYQVTTSGGVSGYIRSDLVQKSSDGGSTGATGINPTVEVTQVQPTGASITGGENVRVRPDASTSGNFITTVSNGTAVTVKGKATGTDGYVWYLVTFNANNTEVEGFVRSDFVNVSGELVPADTTTPVEDEGEGESTETQEPVQDTTEQKLYDTKIKDDGTWVLLDYTKGQEWNLVELLDSYQKNGAELIEAKKDIKTQKIIIIILVIVVVGAVLAATMLYFKVKDISDEAYFAAVEKETIRERNAMKGQQGKDPRAPGRKVMQTVGTDGSRTVDSRSAAKPQGNSSVQNQAAKNQTVRTQAGGQARQVVPPTVNGRAAQSSGQAKPAQTGVQNRPAQAGTQSRPVQQSAQSRPVQQSTQSRPVQQSAQGRNVQPTAQSKPVSQGNTQANPTAQTTANKPAGVNSQPVNAGTSTQNTAQNQAQTKQFRSTAPVRSKNVMDEDDEFEFEFLNWDGEDK